MIQRIQHFNKFTLVTMALVLALAGCAEEDPLHFIQEGQVLFQKGDLKSAEVQFKNALQLNPKLADAYYGLALIEEKRPDWEAAKQLLQEVVALEPSHVDAHVKLGFMLLGQLDKAKEHAAIALKLDSENDGAILLDGRIKSSEGQYTEALKQAEKVLIKDQDLNTEALWLKATVFIDQKRYQDALETIAQGLDLYPDNIALGLLKVRVHREQKKYKEILNDYAQLVSGNPDNKDLRLKQIGLLARYGKPQQVEHAMLDTIERYPNDTGLMIALVDYLERWVGPNQAEEQIKEFVSLHPENQQLRMRLAKYYLQHKAYSNAESEFDHVLGSDPNGSAGLEAKVYLAEIAWIQQDKARAEKWINEILTIDKANSAALMMRSGIRLSQKEADQAISDLRIVLRDQPDADQALVNMARSYVLKGEHEVAESYWRKALEANPGNLDAVVPLVSARTRRNDVTGAEDLLTKALTVRPGHPVLIEMWVKLKASVNDWAGAHDILGNFPKDVYWAQMLTAMLFEKQGKYQNAIEVYQSLLSRDPEASGALTAIVQAYKTAGKRKELIEYLKGYLQQNPQNVKAMNLLAHGLAVREQWAEAAQVLQQAIQVDPDFESSYLMLAEVLTRQGKMLKSRDVLLTGLQKLPDNPRLMMELAKFHEENKDKKEAISLYERVLKNYPDNQVVINNLAALLIDSKSMKEGDIQRLVGVVAAIKKSDNPYFQDTYGWVMLKSGDVKSAITALKKAAEALPENALVRYHLGEAYHAAGNNKASSFELEKSIALAKQQRNRESAEQAKQLLKQIKG